MSKLELNISLYIAEYCHLADKSVYNKNYYRIKPDGYDNSLYGCDVVLEICCEDENYFDYTLGRFEGDTFIAVFGWTHYGYESIFKD